MGHMEINIVYCFSTLPRMATRHIFNFLWTLNWPLLRYFLKWLPISSILKGKSLCPWWYLLCRELSVHYLSIDKYGEQNLQPILCDMDLDSAFMSSTDSILRLFVETKPKPEGTRTKQYPLLYGPIPDIEYGNPRIRPISKRGPPEYMLSNMLNSYQYGRRWIRTRGAILSKTKS